LPVLPHQFSARRAGTGLCNEVVDVLRQHMEASCCQALKSHTLGSRSMLGKVC
jgi:hypothetical protein